MRVHSVVLLACILLSSMFLLMNTDHAYAQTDSITTARTDLVLAFQSIETAQQQGASTTDLLPLINQLNTALQYANNATVLQKQNATDLADAKAQLSITISTNVSLQAQRLGNEAQSASVRRSALAYSIALIAAVLAAIAVVESPRAKRFLARRQLGRARIVHG